MHSLACSRWGMLFKAQNPSQTADLEQMRQQEQEEQGISQLCSVSTKGLKNPGKKAGKTGRACYKIMTEVH